MALRIGDFFAKKDGDEQPDEDVWMDGTSAFEVEEDVSLLPVLSKAQVEAVRFHTSKPGYAFAQVEEFVRQVAASLQASERSLYEKDVALFEAQQELGLLQEQVSDLQSTIEVFRAKGDVLVDADGQYVTESRLADVTAVSAERDALAAENEGLRADLDQYSLAYDALEAEKSQLAIRLADLENQVEVDESEWGDEGDGPLKAALDAAERARADAEAEVERLKAEIDALHADTPDLVDATVEEAERLRVEAAAARDEAAALLAQAEAERDAAVMAKDEAILDKNGLAAQVAALVAERDAAVAAQEEAASALAAAMESTGVVTADVETALAAKAKAEEEAAQLRQQLEVAETVGDDAVLREEIARLQAERDEALAAEAELREYVDTVLAQWQAQVESAAAEVPVEVTEVEETMVSDTPWGLSDEDDEWGDAPTAHVEPAPGPAASPEGDAIPFRQRAPLADAPEVRGQG